jgi:hypothetical protein
MDTPTGLSVDQYRLVAAMSFPLAITILPTSDFRIGLLVVYTPVNLAHLGFDLHYRVYASSV